MEQRRSRDGSVRVRVSVVVVLALVVVAAGAFALPRPRAHASGAPVASATTSTSTASTSTASTVCAGVKGETVMADGMIMAPVPGRAAGAADRSAARRLVSSVGAGIAKYARLPAAIAAGYVPATNPFGYVVHYAKWSVVLSGDVLDASSPPELVYARTVAGPELLGAMFLGPAPCVPGPDVAGPLTQWHAHADLCLSATHEVVGTSNASGRCAVGIHNTNTYFMMHVWTATSLSRNYQFAAHVPVAAYAAIIRSGRA